MATITEANALMTEVAGQSIASAISTMSATSVGNLSALTTTDKTSLVGAINELKSGLNTVGACDNLLAIGNADTTQYAFINNIAGYRLLLIYTSYYANSPNPVYNSVVLPVALLASMTEYMEFDGIKIAFSYGVNGVQVTDWSTNSHPYVNFVGIK